MRKYKPVTRQKLQIVSKDGRRASTFSKIKKTRLEGTGIQPLKGEL